MRSSFVVPRCLCFSLIWIIFKTEFIRVYYAYIMIQTNTFIFFKRNKIGIYRGFQ